MVVRVWPTPGWARKERKPGRDWGTWRSWRSRWRVIEGEGSGRLRSKKWIAKLNTMKWRSSGRWQTPESNHEAGAEMVWWCIHLKRDPEHIRELPISSFTSPKLLLPLTFYLLTEPSIYMVAGGDFERQSLRWRERKITRRRKELVEQIEDRPSRENAWISIPALLLPSSYVLEQVNL